MKVVTKLLAAATIAVSAGSASATLMMNDAHSVNTNVSSSSIKYTTLNIVDEGFMVGIDSIAFATLHIGLTDTNKGNEAVKLSVGSQMLVPSSGQRASTVNDVADSDVVTYFNIFLYEASLADLIEDGLITVGFGSLNGSYRVQSTSLDYALIPGEVPEPFSLALMGAGLAGIGMMRRRRS